MADPATIPITQPSMPSGGGGGFSGMSSLIGSLDRLESTVRNASMGTGGAPQGGPLGALTSIGSSWGASAAFMGARLMGQMAGNMLAMNINQGTADIRSQYDPGGGAAMRAAAWQPYGALKSLPFVGQAFAAQEAREREPMERHAMRMQLGQDYSMGNITELNNLRTQIASANISLNRQYSGPQAAYQLDLIQPKTIENDVEKWHRLEQSKWEDTKYYQRIKELQNTMADGPGTPLADAAKEAKAQKEARTTSSAAAEENYKNARTELDNWRKDESDTNEKAASAKILRQQAAERYTQNVYGQFQPMEQSNVYSAAISAVGVGGLPLEDPNVKELKTSNATLTRIEILLDKWDKKFDK